LVKDHPREKGLHPYGWELAEVPDENRSEMEKATSISLKEALGIPTFWAIGLTFLAYGMSMGGALQNQVSILTEQDVNITEAVGTIGVVGLLSGVGKPLFGCLCDHIDPKYAAAISFALVATSLVVINQAHSTALIWLYAVLLGLGLGGWAPNLATLTANYFGLQHYGTLLGAMHMMCNIGLGIGPMVAGFAYDQTGSYHEILSIFIILCCISIPFIAVARKPKILTERMRSLPVSHSKL